MTNPETIFADVIEATNRIQAQLVALHGAAGDVLTGDDRAVIQELVYAILADNNQVAKLTPVIWQLVLELVRQRDAVTRSSFALAETQTVQNIACELDIDNEQARIVFDFVTGRLDDWVWGNLSADAKTALRKIADDVLQDRRENSYEEAV
jgi:hypothetical protein